MQNYVLLLANIHVSGNSLRTCGTTAGTETSIEIPMLGIEVLFECADPLKYIREFGLCLRIALYKWVLPKFKGVVLVFGTF